MSPFSGLLFPSEPLLARRTSHRAWVQQGFGDMCQRRRGRLLPVPLKSSSPRAGSHGCRRPGLGLGWASGLPQKC